MGRICFGLHHYRPACTYYARSHELVGENYVTYYNLGIALFELGDLAGAERLLQKCLQLNEYERAIVWLAKARNERARRVAESLPEWQCGGTLGTFQCIFACHLTGLAVL